MEFHQYLKKVRHDNKYSQEQLAIKLGYNTSQFISNWERGVSLPPMDILAKIVTIFRLNKAEVFKMYVEEITKKKLNEFQSALKKGV